MKGKPVRLLSYCPLKTNSSCHAIKRCYEYYFQVYFLTDISWRTVGTFYVVRWPNCALMLAGVLTKRPSVFMMPPVEHIKQDTVTLTCYVKDFYPKEVFVSWLVDDELAKDKFTTTTPIDNQGSYSAYGQLTLGQEQWKKQGMVYSCVVYHQSLVSNTRAIVRSIGYNTNDRLNLVNLSLNIPDKC